MPKIAKSSMGDSRLSGGGEPLSAASLILYSRPVCHLCDLAKPVVFEVAAQYGVTVEERNVENDPRWEKAYGDQIPVAFLGGRKLFKYRVDRDQLARQLADT